MAELLISLGAIFFEIITKILEIRKEKKDERNKIDFFRALVQCHDIYAKKFTEKALNAYVPHAVINTKKEEKLKRNVSKFCIFIPEVIEYSGFIERFPKLLDIKSHLFNFLLEFELKSFDQIKKDYSDGVTLINKIYIFKEKEVTTYKQGFLNYLRREKLPSSIEPANLNKEILDYKKAYYDSEGITPDLQDQGFKYIDNMVTGLIREEYIPLYENTSRKGDIITWEAGAKG